MIIDRLIPAALTTDPEDRRRSRLIIYAIGVATVATALVAVITTVMETSQHGGLMLLSTIPYFAILGVLHITQSAKITAHLLMIAIFTMIAIDLGKESGYGILAGIALPVGAAALIGVNAALAWMGVAVTWQVYLAPIVLRADLYTLEAGVSSAVLTLAVGTASAVVERLREQAMAEAITQRRKLEEYSDRIRLFAEQTFPAIMEIANDEVAQVTSGFDDLLGYEPNTINTATVEQFMHPDDLARLRTQAQSSEGNGFHSELRMRHSDGHWIWLEVFGIPLPSSQQDSGWMYVARDAHDEIISRERVLQAQKLSSVGTLAAGLAHDLNNLLTVVVGHASLLPESESREQILKAGDKATELVRSLRTFTHQAESSTQTTDCVEAVRQVADMSEPLLGSRIALHIHSELEHALVRLEPGAMNQLLLNLMTNAKEAIEDAGTISIVIRHRLESGQAMVVIEISDTGLGMDEATLKRAFEPFYTTKPMHQASGLGLASAYGIAQRAGGRLSLTSTPNVGTTATIELPQVEPTAEQAAHLADTEHKHYNGEPCILVEDDTAVRDVLSRCLANLGFTVHQADNANVGRRLVDDHQPALVVTDVVMPGMRGSEFARELRRANPELPILIVSGYDQDQSTQQHAQDPRIRFLAKPIGVADLARQVNNLLGRQT